MILAPTGSAAHLIDGNTIHDKLMFRPGNELTFEGERFHKFDENMEKVKFIVIDESSMVGLSLMGKIDKRLRLTGCPDRPFGGYNMIFVGDVH